MTRKLSAQKLAVLTYVQAHQPVRRDALATVLGVAEACCGAAGRLPRWLARPHLRRGA